MKITYIHEPNDLQCGQAVLAMLTGKSVGSVCGELKNDRETTLSEMKRTLADNGFKLSAERKQAFGNAGDNQGYKRKPALLKETEHRGQTQIVP